MRPETRPAEGVASIDSPAVSGPVTQSFRLRWRPVVRYYEYRIPILRQLEEDGRLEAFRVSEDSAEAALPNWRWLSIIPSGLTLNILGEGDDTSEVWANVRAVCEVMAPLHFSHARVSYQHVAPLPMPFEEAVSRGHARLYRDLRTTEVALDDWALLSNLSLAGPPAAIGQIEFGIVQPHELQGRLMRQVGRGPGMLHLGQRDWPLEGFKDVSLYADSDLTSHADPERPEAFLEDAARFWEASRTEMSRLVEGFRRKLVSNGGE